ncbi:MAG: hypothetical protein PVF64_04075, partial [Desulfobacterales bacterium]
GARPIHVAQYAKKWKRFYGYLRKNVMHNAVNYAAKYGFEAVTCGHTHYAEEQFVNGIKYLNTGAWTEQPTYFVRVSANEIMLEKAADWVKRLNASTTKTIHLPSGQRHKPGKPVSHHN